MELDDNDEVASGEVAVLESEVDKFENIFRASGKFGVVAGVGRLEVLGRP